MLRGACMHACGCCAPCTAPNMTYRASSPLGDVHSHMLWALLMLMLMLLPAVYISSRSGLLDDDMEETIDALEASRRDTAATDAIPLCGIAMAPAPAASAQQPRGLGKVVACTAAVVLGVAALHKPLLRAAGGVLRGLLRGPRPAAPPLPPPNNCTDLPASGQPVATPMSLPCHAAADKAKLGADLLMVGLSRVATTPVGSAAELELAVGRATEHVVSLQHVRQALYRQHARRACKAHLATRLHG